MSLKYIAKKAIRNLSGLTALALLFISSSNIAARTRPLWNGYIQTRYTENYRSLSSFELRRAKLWVKGKAPIQGNWFYKVQAIFRQKSSGNLTMQDFYAEYRYHTYVFRMGQMVPDFSLQRRQPDYVIPVLERAAAINNLIPTAESGARDIGIMAEWHSSDRNFTASAGMFNGNGSNTLHNEDRRFLFTHRLTADFSLPDHIKAHLGYSLAYRNTTGLSFKRIFGNNAVFKGDDFRWGVETRIAFPDGEIQSEYLEAHLGSRKAWAYYLLTDYKLLLRNQIVFSMEKFCDLNPVSNDQPWYIVGWNHYFAGNQAKLMLDTQAQFANGSNNYQTIIQLQLMFL